MVATGEQKEIPNPNALSYNPPPEPKQSIPEEKPEGLVETEEEIPKTFTGRDERDAQIGGQFS